MQAQPSLSIVVPAWNSARHIGAALDSLIRQSRTDFEVIVVDDGSTDDTAAVVAAMAATVGPRGPAIRLHRQSNAGASAARNMGISIARADLVGFLDADDCWSPEKVRTHVALMQARPEIDLSFSGFCIITDEGRATLELYRPEEGILPLPRLMERNIIHTSTVITRTSALDVTGGFDPAKITYEDFDLWLRIGGLRPNNIWGIHACLADYRRHETQTTRDWRKMHEGWKIVAKGLAQSYPADWMRVESRAWAHQMEYCASLAFNARDLPTMRRLMRQAWGWNGMALLGRKDGFVMTGIMVCSYLPKPLQWVAGKSFAATRWIKRRAESAMSRMQPPRGVPGRETLIRVQEGHSGGASGLHGAASPGMADHATGSEPAA